MRYEGIDLTRFSSTLLLEVFLGLQLRVFAAYEKPVEVVFPEPVPSTTVAFWRAYHDAEHVTISPIDAVGAYSPWAAGTAPTARRSAGVLFGGGKDSTLATCLLSEICGADEVVLFQFVAPHHPGAELAERLERRQEGQMLRPAREGLGVATQRAWTDYMVLHRDSGFRARPHLELYTAGLLPALLVWGVNVCSPGFSWISYPIRRQANGRISFGYAKSRPEMLATQSRHYQRVLGADLTLTNLNLHFTSNTVYRMLAERYPHALSRIVSCVSGGVDERWCYQCEKCAVHAMYSLVGGMVDPSFDYDRFFGRSRYMRRVVAYIESGVERTVYGNAPWTRVFSSRNRYFPDCQTLAALSPGLIADRLGGTAFTNLLMLKAAFGNTAFPTFECSPSQVTALLGNEWARRVAAIVAQHLRVVDVLPGPFHPDDPGLDYDFRVRMPTKTELLDHIRA